MTVAEMCLGQLIRTGWVNEKRLLATNPFLGHLVRMRALCQLDAN
jgi:hypothetical protein